MNQGCSRISRAESLSVGSRRIMERIRHFAFDEIVSGIVKCPRLIFVNNTLGSVSWNGYRPTNIVYSITPRLQTSAALPE